MSNFCCQLCNKSNNLDTHHKECTNNVEEIEHLEDLVCLCGECHKKFHNK